MNTASYYDIIDNFQDEVMIEQDACEKKSAETMSLYEIMAVDQYVFLTRNEKFGFDLKIENSEEHIVYSDEGVHPYAIDSLAVFCRRFLHRYETLLNKELEA